MITKRGYGYISPSDPNQRPYRIVCMPGTNQRVEVCVRLQPDAETPLGWWLAGEPQTLYRWPHPNPDWRDVN